MALRRSNPPKSLRQLASSQPIISARNTTSARLSEDVFSRNRLADSTLSFLEDGLTRFKRSPSFQNSSQNTGRTSASICDFLLVDLSPNFQYADLRLAQIRRDSGLPAPRAHEWCAPQLASP